MQDHTPEITQPQLISDEIPYGFCKCGCGEKTWIPTKTQTKNGWIKGQPVNFVHGHARRKGGTLADAFWLHCTQGKPNECWEWQGGITSTGYGQLYYLRGQYKTHRLSYELHHGPIPDGLSVLHKCDNPPCCNPNHLFLGTRTDNARDMDVKGRRNFPKGVECHTAKLTEADVMEIRRLHDQGLSRTEITKLYPVSRGNIGAVVNRKSWKHVP